MLLNMEDYAKHHLLWHQVSDMRISYERGGLNEEDFLGADPMTIWDTWFKQAVHDKVKTNLNELRYFLSQSINPKR